MRKFLVSLFVLLISVSVFSQEEFRRNEIKLNLFPTFIAIYPEITYERVLNESFGIGASLGFSPWETAVQDFNFTPFGRFFFGEKPASGFFIEANASLFSLGQGLGCGCADIYLEEHVSKKDPLHIGIGLGAGWKVLTKTNWVWDIMVGGGRGNDHSVYPRFGVSLGRRF
jgi:hypothetical protein